MKKNQKEVQVAEMHEKLKRSKAVFLADFRGLNVDKATALRNELRNINVEYKVFKNTLFDLAAKDTDYDCLNEFLAGPTAVAISYDDPAAAAKQLAKFSKEAKGVFVLKAGAMSGKVFSAAQVQELADLPSREVLIAKMLGSMQAPATNFVGVLAALPGSLVRVLDAIKNQKQVQPVQVFNNSKI